MKDKFTFRERRRSAKGRWWVPLLKLTSVDIAASLSCTRHLSQPSHTRSQMREWSESVFDSFEPVGVREREREREGKNRGSFGNLKVGGGAGTATWTMCFKLLLALRLSQMSVYKYPQTDLFSSFFYFLGEKYQSF